MGIKAKLPNPIYEVDASKGGYTTSSILSFKEDVHLSKPFYPITQSNFTRDSVATRVKNNGELQIVSSNIPRLDYTDGSGAWLLETATENLQYYSENPSLWSQVTANTVVDNYGTAPNGTQTATLLESNGTWICRGQIFGSFESGSQYTISLYVKALYSGSRNNFLLSTGFGNGPVLEATTEWQRYSYTFTPNQTVSFVSGILRNNDSPDVSLLIWGMQTEKSPFATTYVPNLGTNRTARNLDAPTFIPPSLNPNKFSWVINDMKVNNSEDTNNAYFNLRSSVGLELYQRSVAGNWKFSDIHNGTVTPSIITFETGSTYDFVHNISGSIQIESYANGEYRTTYTASSEWDSIDRFIYVPTILSSKKTNVQFSRMAFYNELLNEAQSKQAMSPNTDYVDLAIQRALVDGAEIILTKKQIEEQLPNNWDEASFLYIPFARKAGKSYSLIGPDLTISRNSTATEVNRDLLLSTVGNNVPRIEFDANGPKGHLVEPQMTNKERFSDPDSFAFPSPWRSTTGSPTIGNYDWPSSVANVLTNAIIISGEIEDERANDGAVITAFQDTTVAAFVRRLDGGPIPNDFSGFYIGSNALNYNLISMTNLGENVYFVVSQGNSGGIQLTVRQTTEQYASLGSGIAVSGFMVVDGYVNLMPSDYIPTNGATVTRLGEYISASNISNLPKEQGFFYGEFYFDNGPTLDSYWMRATNSGLTSRLDFQVLSSGFLRMRLARNGYPTQDVLDDSSISGTNRVHWLIQFKEGLQEIYVNGVLRKAGTGLFGGGFIETLDILSIGGVTTGYEMNGSCIHFEYGNKFFTRTEALIKTSL